MCYPNTECLVTRPPTILFSWNFEFPGHADRWETTVWTHIRLPGSESTRNAKTICVPARSAKTVMWIVAVPVTSAGRSLGPLVFSCGISTVLRTNLVLAALDPLHLSFLFMQNFLQHIDENYTLADSILDGLVRMGNVTLKPPGWHILLRCCME